MGLRFPNVAARYSGSPQLVECEMSERYGEGRVFFIEHMTDLFAADVPPEMVRRVLGHCCAWPTNTYVLQTKNPARMREFLADMPPQVLLGTTIESNRDYGVSKAPPPAERSAAMRWLRENTPHRLFVTVEPVMAFDLDVLAEWIAAIRPDFLNIGADSKRRGVPEPTRAEVLALVEALRRKGVEVRQKTNLDRLIAS